MIDNHYTREWTKLYSITSLNLAKIILIIMIYIQVMIYCLMVEETKYMCDIMY